MTESTPDTRLIFPDELEPGTAIIEKCAGSEHCEFGSTHEPGRRHELTVLRKRAQPGGPGTSAIVIDEDGQQLPWSQADCLPVRILAAEAEAMERTP
jgi:hypothetical protein